MARARTYPIILAHGLLRFDEILVRALEIDNKRRWDRVHYFRRIRTHLLAHGFDVWHSHVGWARRLDHRAASLQRWVKHVIRDTGADRVHIIAHSMGGLDARRMLFNYRESGIADRVASLTTIGTPHWGSPVADLCVRHCPALFDRPRFGLDGVYDLQTSVCASFNALAESWEQTCGVRFRTYATTKNWHYVYTPLKPTWKYIEAHEGANDGLVSVNSAKWQDAYFVPPVLDLDHLNQVGWWDPTDLLRWVWPWTFGQRIRELYLSMARDLASAFPT